MRQRDIGDDAARASGVDANRVRPLLMELGVALTTIVIVAAGPIAFFAAALPRIARRLIRSAGLALLPSAQMGALLLTAADWAAQHAFATQLPVGNIAVSIGGLYFLWLFTGGLHITRSPDVYATRLHADAVTLAYDEHTIAKAC